MVPVALGAKVGLVRTMVRVAVRTLPQRPRLCRSRGQRLGDSYLTAQGGHDPPNGLVARAQSPVSPRWLLPR